MIFGIKFSSKEKYINDVVDYVIFLHENLGTFENLDKLNNFLVEKFRVTSNLSIRNDVIRREILGKLNDNYISFGKNITLNDLIFVIISCEKYELSFDPEIALKVADRLTLRGYV